MSSLNWAINLKVNPVLLYYPLKELVMLCRIYQSPLINTFYYNYIYLQLCCLFNLSIRIKENIIVKSLRWQIKNRKINLKRVKSLGVTEEVEENKRTASVQNTVRQEAESTHLLQFVSSVEASEQSTRLRAFMCVDRHADSSVCVCVWCSSVDSKHLLSHFFFFFLTLIKDLHPSLLFCSLQVVRLVSLLSVWSDARRLNTWLNIHLRWLMQDQLGSWTCWVREEHGAPGKRHKPSKIKLLPRHQSHLLKHNMRKTMTDTWSKHLFRTFYISLRCYYYCPSCEGHQMHFYKRYSVQEDDKRHMLPLVADEILKGLFDNSCLSLLGYCRHTGDGLLSIYTKISHV